MSIAIHPPEPDLASRSRVGGETSVGISRPPKELLPEGGNLAPAPAPALPRVSARDAIRSIRGARRIGSSERLPWPQGSVSEEVEIVRRQLAPIRTRHSLAASYRREAFHVMDTEMDPPDVATVWSPAAVCRLAYAIRWLELGPDRI
jgi:hypothetical protein